MSARRCLCPCHAGSIGDRQRADGVSVTDPIEAAVACDSCRGHHAPALLDPDRPSPRAVTESGEFVAPTKWTPARDRDDDANTIDGEDGG